MQVNERTKFLEWLRLNGAEVLAPTNSYEYARFRAQGAVHVIYEGRKGMTMNGFGEDCWRAFRTGQQKFDMGIVQKSRSSMSRYRIDLVMRDGSDCFFCGKPMPDQDMTVEHLISIQKGGTNHMENLALAHSACNAEADSLPLAHKIRLREKKLKEAHHD